ncbi:TonB-dependent receptor plug domain-containing protein [Sphingobacterium sp. LRF_L2]|uniref:TonB-dependent receptor plug domain-containing protein n=1 Tax=Sphingobacterium sp. LRF_L2 TaxID=3369421 RepID=UPI003F5D5796
MILKKFALSCFLTLVSAVAGAQDIEALLQKINTNHDSRPIEKIHLHLDKPNYTAGETIWFKAYEVIGVENMLSNLSKIAYIDLVSPKDKIVAHMKIPLLSGIGIGDISLSDTLIEGTYRLRGYSNWMRNDSSAYFFQQNIQISNGRLDNVLTQSALKDGNYSILFQDLQQRPLADAKIRYEITRANKNLKSGRLTTDVEGRINIPFKSDYGNAKLTVSFENKEKAPVEKIFKLPQQETQQHNIQFFPEGGTLLAGTLNKIAVKAVRPNGLGIQATTYILTSRGDTAARIQTNNLGMGSAPLFVEENETFTSVTVFEDGTQTSTALPAYSQSGYSIQVNNISDSKLFAQVNLSADKQNGSSIYFILHYLGRTFYVSKQNASKNELVFSVPKKDLPSGVLTISILNDQLIPLIERPVFICNESQFVPFTADLNSPTSSPRKKVSVSIQTGTAQDSIRNAVLSASVVNASKIKKEDWKNSPNILSSLLLNADLSGYIENPGYYFDQGLKCTEIDDLLLTQGWRKLEWKANLEATAPSFLPEKAISIKGQARKLGRKAPASGAKLMLVSTKNFMDYIDTLANEEGYFEFDNLLFPDSAKFLITAKDEKGKNNIDIIISENTIPTHDINKNAPGERNDVNYSFLEDILNNKKYFAGLEAQGLMEKSIAIEEVVVTARRTAKKASESSANLNGPGNADQVITAEDLETCPTLDMCLNGRLMGVTFQNGVPHTTRGGGEMQVVLDGMYIEGDQLSMINPSDIQSVEVLRNINYTSIYGSYGGNGLLIITSKTGKDAMRSYTPKGIVTVQPQGLHINKIFYKPIYEVDSETKLNQDLRTTIHWEPNIVSDNDGKASFDFYTSDEAGRYVITIEGLDFMGRIARKILTLDVK